MEGQGEASEAHSDVRKAGLPSGLVFEKQSPRNPKPYQPISPNPLHPETFKRQTFNRTNLRDVVLEVVNVSPITNLYNLLGPD